MLTNLLIAAGALSAAPSPTYESMGLDAFVVSMTDAQYRAGFDYLGSTGDGFVSLHIVRQQDLTHVDLCVSARQFIQALAIQHQISLTQTARLKEIALSSRQVMLAEAAYQHISTYNLGEKRAAAAFVASKTDAEWLELGRTGEINVRPLDQNVTTPAAALACAFAARGIVVSQEGRASNMFRVASPDLIVDRVQP